MTSVSAGCGEASKAAGPKSVSAGSGWLLSSCRVRAKSRARRAFLTVNGDMAYGVFIERWWGQLKSRSEPAELKLRATLIFRREDGEWKAVHRHGDYAVEKASPS